MIKIVDRQPLGTQPVFDIGLERIHNFLLANGLIASNCFNKSHSTAYGYVTYQTAYLKATYPVEYMAALLTANADDQDKVQKYIADCQNLHITVELPDINRSGIDFTTQGNTILFGLSAVRNVGQAAVEALLAARETGGAFKSLADLCARIDSRAVNRRALECLIKCGAMDCFNSNRNQLLEDLKLLLDWAQSRARERASGQGSLFDLLGDTSEAGNAFDTPPQAPSVPDFPSQEKLKYEKELLGFYISDHPLKTIQQSARVLAPVNLSDLSGLAENASVSAITMITSVKPVTTKKGDRMATLQIEDLSGRCEAVVFPKAFDRIKDLLVPDARLMVWGKVDAREDKRQLIIDDAEPIDQVQLVMVELDPQQANDVNRRNRLREILKDHRGNEDKAKVPVVAIVGVPAYRQFVRLGSQFRVQDPEKTVSDLISYGFRARTASLVSPSTIAS
jgi:DNA polymerase-3 subunit alpha